MIIEKAIHKCLARTHDIRVKISENEMLNGFRTMYAIEMQGLYGGWEKVRIFVASFVK
jgi:hypothetical protein